MASFNFFWEEIDESPGEKVSLEKVEADRVFKVAWSNRIDFVRALLGLQGIIGTLPEQHPGMPAARARSAVIKPFQVKPSQATITDTLTMMSHEFARVEIHYEPIEIPEGQQKNTDDDSDLPVGTYATYDSDSELEAITIPSRALVWEGTTDKVSPDATAVLLIPNTNHNITWHRVYNPPWAAISELRGKVNSVAFRNPVTKTYFAPETLLFLGERTSTTFTTDEQNPLTFALDYVFRERSIKNFDAKHGAITNKAGNATPAGAVDGSNPIYGWNHYFRDNEGVAEWQRVEDYYSGEYPYQSGDFSALFKFNAFAE